MVLKQLPKCRTVYLSKEIDSEGTATKEFKMELQKIINADNAIIEDNIRELSGLGEEYVKVYMDSLVYPDITVDITTPGGAVYYGMAIYDTIKSINDAGRYTINAKCSGFVASVGTIILLACKERVAAPNTRFMIHSVSACTRGKVEQMKEDVDESNTLNDILRSIIAENTTLTKKQLKENDEKKKDWWLNTKEALNVKLITKIE